MSVAATVNTTTQQVAVTVNPTTREVAVTVSNARGAAGSNSVTSSTTSDGTADLDLLNVETVNATVSDTLTADHIHGNLAGSVYAHIRAGEALTKGDPVYVSGSHGSGSSLIPIVSKADASNAAKMPAVGIMDADVANNANGHMVIVGTITQLNTAGLTVNAELYVASAGGLTATPPTARAQPVARVERVNANNGAILVQLGGLSASDATANTLVRRTVTGGVSLGEINLSGSIAPAASGQYDIGLDDTPVKGVYCQTMTVLNAATFNATTYNYGANAASAHRIALGAGTTGAALFGAADAAAARTTLELGAFSTNGSITGTGALTLTSASGQPINLAYGAGSFVHITSGTLPASALLSTDFALISANATAPGFSIVSASSSNAAHRAVFKGVRSRGTLTSPLAASSGDSALSFLAAVYDGSAVQATAVIDFVVDGAVSVGTAPQKIVFFTGPTNGASRAERMTIKSDGNVGIGTTSPSALLDVNSNTVRLRTARTPASAGAAGNAGDICWDADYIYVCTATNTWKRTAISTWP
jgi:hypothetical protein